MVVQVILLSVDDDANIIAITEPVFLEPETNRHKASEILSKELGTNKHSFVFFVRRQNAIMWFQLVTCTLHTEPPSPYLLR
ncbi:hypothetical protein GYMLUDRAFT_46233 [Collybiopsis luxurians FD-317 M1]|uniref:Uncharacterized protein n=1 Tax=Collybiopsis luxurians FD-317 M1 TaxID=944289 RepID=A0A0D0CPR4_9AGAR|nr:hypothetical protein GYMLUDRAFT_46233 [Collybiopsis luxurians FD-317 M1]